MRFNVLIKFNFALILTEFIRSFSLLFVQFIYSGTDDEIYQICGDGTIRNKKHNLCLTTSQNTAKLTYCVGNSAKKQWEVTTVAVSKSSREKRFPENRFSFKNSNKCLRFKPDDIPAMKACSGSDKKQFYFFLNRGNILHEGYIMPKGQSNRCLVNAHILIPGMFNDQLVCK